MEIEKIFFAFFLVINFIAFFIMLIDKYRSGRGMGERISEGMIFFLATFLGAFGVLIGMFIFHHKTKKWYFLIGIPFLIIQNISLICLVYLFLYKSVSW